MSDPYWKGMRPEQFVEYLEEATTITRREAKKALRRGAKKILAASIAMAPVDEHDLENAHHLETVRLNKDDMMIEISVGGMVGDEDVSAYAWIIHGGYFQNLGEKSLQKSASNPAPYNGQVGPGFLDRAVDMHSKEVAEEVAETLKEFK